MNLWKWLYNLSSRKIQDNHLKKTGSDIKCPNCNDWFSVSGINHEHTHISKPEWGYHLKCGKCNHDSYWNADIAPMLLHCDCDGKPYQCKSVNTNDMLEKK